MKEDMILALAGQLNCPASARIISSVDVQNMMPKIITYRSRPKKKDLHRVPVFLMK